MAFASTTSTPSPNPFTVRVAAPTNVQLRSSGRAVRRWVAIVSLMVLVMLGAAGVVGASTPEAIEHHTVHRGDTLWSIAEGRTAPGGDVRRTIAEIVDANGLTGADISVGQVLVVPAR